MRSLFLGTLLLVTSPATAMDDLCKAVINSDLGRLNIGTYDNPRGVKGIKSGMVAGVGHNYNRLLALESKYEEEQKEIEMLKMQGRYVASTSDTKIALKSLKNEFTSEDLVYLGLGYKYSETEEVSWKGRRLRIYWLGDDVSGFLSDLSGDPIITKLNSSCMVEGFHILGAKTDRSPFLSFNSNSCAVMDKINRVAPMISSPLRGQSEDALCESVGGRIDARNTCRCRRERSKTILPPYEVCNESEMKRQARRAVQIMRSVGNKLDEEYELDRIVFEKVERACRVYSKYLDKSDFQRRLPAKYIDNRESRRR